MPELLLELFSEEIPARMQARAAADLQKAVQDRLFEAGLAPDGAKAFATPRRLTLVVTGLDAVTPDRKDERKGPRVGAPDKAVAGFLKAAGLDSLDQCETRSDKKGEYYVAVTQEKGRATADLVAEAVPDIVKGFSWPKSMRWGDGDMRWVRPLHSILCVFDGQPVAFCVGDVESGDITRGHRFMAPDVIHARGFEEYDAALRAAKVVLDPQARREIISHEAKTLCEAQGLTLVDDPGLLAEVAGLVEWPVVMMGDIDPKFLELPDEVLITSMRSHQKYFSVHDPKTDRLAPKFIFVANLEAADGGAAMRKGYERVLTARLSDGYFLYKQDLKTPLEERVKDLAKVTYFDKLGSIGDKVERVAALAREIAPLVGADPDIAERAARLAKADLVTGMVYEFPDLQGVMGRYYALEEAESEAVANAIRDHYKPAGQSDEIPTQPVSASLALADKVDALTSFWFIDERPTGSKDPFALRRAALGAISIILTSSIRVSLYKLFRIVGDMHLDVFTSDVIETVHKDAKKIEQLGYAKPAPSDRLKILETYNPQAADLIAQLAAMEVDLLAFFHDRLKVYLRDKGARHDYVDAVLHDAAGTPQDDLVLIVRRLEALENFLKTPEGENLLAAYKRASNILAAEAKKGKGASGAHVDAAQFVQAPGREEEGAAEAALHDALTLAGEQAKEALGREAFAEAMAALSALRAPLDAFFETVTVNAEDAKVRDNRLNLLREVRASIDAVADFSKLEG